MDTTPRDNHPHPLFVPFSHSGSLLERCIVGFPPLLWSAPLWSAFPASSCEYPLRTERAVITKTGRFSVVRGVRVWNLAPVFVPVLRYAPFSQDVDIAHPLKCRKELVMRVKSTMQISWIVTVFQWYQKWSYCHRKRVFMKRTDCVLNGVNAQHLVVKCYKST